MTMYIQTDSIPVVTVNFTVENYKMIFLINAADGNRDSSEIPGPAISSCRLSEVKLSNQY